MEGSHTTAYSGAPPEAAGGLRTKATRLYGAS